MNKPIKPMTASIIMLAVALVILALLPFNIEITPRTAEAQDTPDVEYTLTTAIAGEFPMQFVGVGGDIDGQVNPTLNAEVGQLVQVTLINGDPVLHDLTIDEFGVTTGQVVEQGETAVIQFTPLAPGEFTYYCSIPGHREIGMEGLFVITGEADPSYVAPVATTDEAMVEVQPADENAVSIIHHPTDLPAPIGDREATNVQLELTAQEVVGQLADGSTFDYYTFDGTVPGPMLRVRVGDMVELTLNNAIESTLIHSIDLHAVTGPGGGAVATQVLPGESASFTFQALQPGIYVYHCATPSVPHHIANGMYGMILVEPEGGLPEVDREFYVMQGEMYTEQEFGTQGHLTFSHEAMLDEQPEYFVFNGAAGALTLDDYALRANVGETVRIYFGVGGPNFISSFHVIGEIFDRVYNMGSVTAEPIPDVQTTIVPPGGATIVEFSLQVPGRYILVDHALSRLERGLAGFLYAEGEDNPDVFSTNGEASDE